MKRLIVYCPNEEDNKLKVIGIFSEEELKDFVKFNIQEGLKNSIEDWIVVPATSILNFQ